MEKFIKPEMEIVEFDSNDVIVTSGSLPLYDEEVEECPTKDCSVYGIQW